MTVSVKARSISVAIKLPPAAAAADGKPQEEAKWLFEPLYMEVRSDAPEVTCTPYKVELRVTKAEPAQWPSLELRAGAAAVGSGSAAAAAAAVVAAPVDVQPKTSHELQYPNSKGKDWGKFRLDDEEDKKAGDAALNSMFQKIYAGASDEVRQAMNKSFVESGGTTLSTNVKDVMSRYVHPTAPHGMQVQHNTSEDARRTALAEEEERRNPKKDRFGRGGDDY